MYNKMLKYIKNWTALTNESMSNYSKIHDVNCVTDDIKYDEKLLFLEFYENNALDVRCISNKLHIIRTVKDGDIICGKSLNIASMYDTLGRQVYSYSSYGKEMFQGGGGVLFYYHNPSKKSGCAKYSVRLYEDKLLEDIRTKQKPIPSLLQLCVSAISSKELKQYNDINRTMLLAM